MTKVAGTQPAENTEEVTQNVRYLKTPMPGVHCAFQGCFKSKNIKTQAKPNTLLSNTHPDKVKLTLTNGRMKCSQLKKDITRMKSEIKLSEFPLSSDLMR